MRGRQRVASEKIGPVQETIPPPLWETFDEAVSALENGGVPFVIGGGLAAKAYNLRLATDDIDIFVSPTVAQRATEALARAGFETWIEDPSWLHKAVKHGVEVDIIYESGGTIHIGEETVRRAPELELAGRRVKVLPVEVFFVMKAVVANPETPRHWRDAVNVLKRYEMDWDYVVRLATIRPRKVLEALIRGHKEGVEVPARVFAELAAAVLKEC